MDVKNNNLFRIKEDKKTSFADLLKESFEVPPKLKHAANVALKGKEQTTISKNSGGKLSNWAKKVRWNNGIKFDDD